MAFGVGSVTKTFVAAVTLQLVDEGMLDLEDPIDLWLPSLANIDGAVTIRQLLNHTSGLYSFTEHPDRNDSIIADIDRVWTPDETLRAFVLPPYQAPGVAFRYSNTNYVLLGMVIEAVTGSRFSAELRSRILDPLGLSRTYLAVEEVVSQPVAHMWFDWDADGSEDDMSQYSMNSLFSMDWTAGAVFSTAEDLVRFSQALFEEDLVEASSLAAMLDFFPVGGELGYGLGISITEDFVPGIQGVGHDGVIAGYSARVVITQSPPVYISVLQNHDDFDCKAAISRALWEVATGF